MDAKTLNDLIRESEGIKLDFKECLYGVNHPDPKIRDMQWGEFIKDILSLANGNVESTWQTGYLIIGVGDQIQEDGKRELFDIQDVKISAKDILSKVNSFCTPPLPDLQTEKIILNDKTILAIIIPPSPFIHETTKKIITKENKQYSESTVFIRRGESIYPANQDERSILAERKRNPRKTQNSHSKRSSNADTLLKYTTFVSGVILLTFLSATIYFMIRTWNAHDSLAFIFLLILLIALIVAALTLAFINFFRSINLSTVRQTMVVRIDTRPSAYLEVLFSDQARDVNRRFSISGTTSIGKNPARANIVFSECRSISSLHCTIYEFNPGWFYIKDEGSTNGSFVNGEKIQPGEQHQKILHDGDVIALGGENGWESVKFLFHINQEN